MSKNKSLLTHFLPPREDLKGQFCLLSGFSASSDFLDKALENFTTYNSLLRKNRQTLNMVLFLDKRKPQINGVSGLYHSLLESIHEDKFSLMHAKVAVMSFALDEFSPVEVIRLLVSTGNWTRMGMKENLDLLWTCDYVLNGENEEAELKLADITKGISFFENLMNWYQVSSQVKGKFQKIKSVTPAISIDDLGRSRFFSTFDQINGRRISMYEGIKDRFLGQIPTKPYNRIFCGSGFYESVDGGDPLEVFSILENDFCANRPFAKNIIGVVAVNQKDLWKFKNLQRPKSRISWSVCRPKDYQVNKGAKKRDMLHAKFILGGYLHQDTMTQFSFYLGSANLSKKGLLTNLDNSQGNIEAGIVLRTDDFNTDYTVKTLLCLGDDVSPEELIQAQGVDEYEELEGDSIFASPIKSIFNFNFENRQGEIEWGESPRDCFFMIDAHSKLTIGKEQSVIVLPIECELKGYIMVMCEGEKSPHFVPIISSEGEYCATPPLKLDASSALDTLMTFPELDIEEDDCDDEDVVVIHAERLTRLITPQLGKGSARTLSVAMEMVEGISRKNQVTPKAHLNSWFNCLEKTLTRCLLDQEIQAFSSLKINFLDTLKREHFSPPWHLIDSNELREEYERVIDKVAEIWGMKDYPTFEDKK